MTYSKINHARGRIITALRQRMLRTSLWGVLDITVSEKRYDIIEIVNEMIERESFKKNGFTLKLIDGMNFVQKIPYFDGNDEFIKENKLYLYDDRPSYQAYLKHMFQERKKYNNENI